MPRANNIDLIKCADYIIDLGVEGGKRGGNLIYQGNLVQFVKDSHSSLTSQFLKEKLI